MPALGRFFEAPNSRGRVQFAYRTSWRCDGAISAKPARSWHRRSAAPSNACSGIASKYSMVRAICCCKLPPWLKPITSRPASEQQPRSKKLMATFTCAANGSISDAGGRPISAAALPTGLAWRISGAASGKKSSRHRLSFQSFL